ncbi:MAG: MFS transporter [Candidatus Sungbacteria bacterium]|uniref:MFS transporter n=1 Tax=Candidatus Sungiibacteriota bacterium TaxID=2750080 RepID=A0A932DS74_9BACT|nr:MFS transporter [Candidatus Sungbacteria bacterium]MBI2465612.1 MFS transporter [Candidatus Sungbacteria bacterium]
MFKGINRIVKTIVVADFFYNSAFASFGPVFAIFLTSQIEGGSAQVAGFAASIYWVVKSVVQLPIARFLDKTDGERDDFWALFLGYFLSGLVPLAYIFATKPMHLYFIQGFYGFIMAWAVPAWYSIFTRHVDKWRISFEWSLDSVFSVGLAAATATALGGYVADRFGFTVLFMAASAGSVFSSLLLLGLINHLAPKKHVQNKIMPERRRTHKYNLN